MENINKEAPYMLPMWFEVLHDRPIFWKNVFCSQNWGNGPKKGFLDLKKNLVISFH